jgi:hypothetical protein
MRTLIVLGLIGVLPGCASYRKAEPVTPPKPVPVQVEKKVKRVTNPVKKAQKTVKKSQAVWHLIYPGEVEFGLSHQRTGKKEFIRVETVLSDIDLPPGHYNIESIVVGPDKYEALEGQELFQFEIRKKASTYIGSFVVECPKVGTLHLDELRKMKFFNRLNFTGSNGACEMIVGNDIDNVRRAWSKLEKKPGSKLLLGF